VRKRSPENGKPYARGKQNQAAEMLNDIERIPRKRLVGPKYLLTDALARLTRPHAARQLLHPEERGPRQACLVGWHGWGSLRPAQDRLRRAFGAVVIGAEQAVPQEGRIAVAGSLGRATPNGR
jgi:hypothetical protein